MDSRLDVCCQWIVSLHTLVKVTTAHFTPTRTGIHGECGCVQGGSLEDRPSDVLMKRQPSAHIQKEAFLKSQLLILKQAS